MLFALAMPSVTALVQLAFVVVALGLFFWWLQSFNMPEPFKTGLFVLGALILLVLVASTFGVW